MMAMRIPMGRFGLGAILTLLLGGCASTDGFRDRNPDPDTRLDLILSENLEARQRGDRCQNFPAEPGRSKDCQRLQREVARLYAEYPERERVLMANAVLQFDEGRYEAAQFLLDQLLAKPGSHPEAGILRARIALAEGNTTRARAVLEQQIRLRPDYAELHETVASAEYLDGNYEAALRSLRVAQLLGAPAWRLSYHRGLIEEARGHPDIACGHYRDATLQQSGFRPAVARMLGLSDNAACALMFEGLEASRGSHQH